MQNRELANWWQNASLPVRALMIILVAPLLVINGWAFATIFNYFRSLLTILVSASLLAFLLNYPISFLEQRGAKRGPVAVLVFLVAIALLTALGITLLPDALTQAQQLVTRLPELIDSGRRQVIMLNEQAESLGLPLNFDSLFVQISERLKGQIQAIAGQVLNLAVVTVTSLLDFALTLVLAFYVSQHGDEVWAGLISWLPAKVQRPFSQTLRLSFQNFFINQLIIATCMASALVPSFLWLKVPFGLLFGLTIGIMALVPFGGTVGIIIVTILVTLQNFWLGLQTLMAAVIVQQILENLVAPRLLGSFTGLNPVWILIAILTGARVGGLLGVIVAVPIAVVIKTALVALRMPDSEAPSALVIDDLGADPAHKPTPSPNETPVRNLIPQPEVISDV